ncbi:prepilin signal peptidase PulO-like enzyme (type II secretory pathway) [Bacillus sp. JUb11]|nr:prepilin signal peptidase PulO-like enzyme (type II secretory pathway) [Bacillus sp. JUb11]
MFYSLEHFKPNSMGGADVKLFGVLAFCFGFKPFLIILFLSSVTGMVYANVFSYKANEPFPFVPAIACSFWFYLFCGDLLNPIGDFFG